MKEGRAVASLARVGVVWAWCREKGVNIRHSFMKLKVTASLLMHPQATHVHVHVHVHVFWSTMLYIYNVQCTCTVAAAKKFTFCSCTCVGSRAGLLMRCLVL